MNAEGIASPAVKLDGKVPTGVLEIIGQSRRYVALVSPYNERVPRIETELRLVIQRGVRVVASVKEDGNGRLGGSKGAGALDWLKSLKVDLRSIKWLTAQVYLNESQSLVTSMNLLNSSWDNSHELGLLLDKGPVYQQVFDYIFNRVLKLGDVVPTKRPVSIKRRREPQSLRDGFGRALRRMVSAVEAVSAARLSSHSAQTGHCATWATRNGPGMRTGSIPKATATAAGRGAKLATRARCAGAVIQARGQSGAALAKLSRIHMLPHAIMPLDSPLQHAQNTGDPRATSGREHGAVLTQTGQYISPYPTQRGVRMLGLASLVSRRVTGRRLQVIRAKPELAAKARCSPVSLCGAGHRR